MSTALLIVVGVLASVAVLVARALAVDEVKGRLQRRIRARLEATIVQLPDALQAEWAEEWRAELAAIITMPLSAAQFVRGIRHIAGQLAPVPALAAADTASPAPASPAWLRRTSHRLRSALTRSTGSLGRRITLTWLAIARTDRDDVPRLVGVVVGVAGLGVGLVAGLGVGRRRPRRRRRRRPRRRNSRRQFAFPRSPRIGLATQQRPANSPARRRRL